MKKCHILAVVALLGLLLMPISASAYLVGPSPTLEQTAAQADIVLKVQVISSRDAQDSWLGTMPGTSVEETRLRVISALKGNPTCPIILFRHYKALPIVERFSIGSIGPICYQFEPGRAYLIFAKTDGDACTYRQIWKYPPGFGSDQGVLLCADAKPFDSFDLYRAVWHELMGLLKSPRFEDKRYAIYQLNSRSGKPDLFMTTDEFDRDRVLAVCAPLLSSSDQATAAEALFVFGEHSPFLYDETGTHWSPRQFDAQPVYSPTSAEAAANRVYAGQILSLANKSSDANVRISAIRTLNAGSPFSGISNIPNFQDFEMKWANDAQPKARIAAALILGGDLAPAGQGLLQKLSTDQEPSVRMAVARGIKLSQNSRAVPLLVSLLHDTDLNVREAAASSLAALPVAETQSVIQANIGHPQFGSIFLLTLAEEKPASNVGALVEIVEKRPLPPDFSGNTPDYEACRLLLGLLPSQTKATLSSVTWIDAVNALEAAQVWNASIPDDLYRFYVSHGMKDSAARLRQLSKPYHLERTFNQIDIETPVLPQ